MNPELVRQERQRLVSKVGALRTDGCVPRQLRANGSRRDDDERHDDGAYGAKAHRGHERFASGSHSTSFKTVMYTSGSPEPLFYTRGRVQITQKSFTDPQRSPLTPTLTSDRPRDNRCSDQCSE